VTSLYNIYWLQYDSHVQGRFYVYTHKISHDDSYKLFYISLYLQHLQPLTILYSKTVHDDNVSYT